MSDFEVVDGDLCGSPFSFELSDSDSDSDFDDCDSICSLWDLSQQVEIDIDSVWGDCVL